MMNATINRTALSKTWALLTQGLCSPPPCWFSTSSAGPPDGGESAKPVLVDSYKKHAEAPGADDQTLGLRLARAVTFPNGSSSWDSPALENFGHPTLHAAPTGQVSMEMDTGPVLEKPTLATWISPAGGKPSGSKERTGSLANIEVPHQG